MKIIFYIIKISILFLKTCYYVCKKIFIIFALFLQNNIIFAKAVLYLKKNIALYFRSSNVFAKKCKNSIILAKKVFIIFAKVVLVLYS